MQKYTPQLIRIKTKYQVTLPPHIRKNLSLKEGDILEIALRDNSIILTPKMVIDKKLSEALRDIMTGAVHGPYPSAKAALRALKK